MHNEKLHPYKRTKSSAGKSFQMQVIILNDLSQSQNSKCHFSCVYQFLYRYIISFIYMKI